ncbi:hypothetical protein D3C72_2430390 [compost metagenome]
MAQTQAARGLPFFVPACQFRPSGHPVQFATMFAAHPFNLNQAPAALAGVVARAITIKTTTIKG